MILGYHYNMSSRHTSMLYECIYFPFYAVCPFFMCFRVSPFLSFSLLINLSLPTVFVTVYYSKSPSNQGFACGLNFSGHISLIVFPVIINCKCKHLSCVYVILSLTLSSISYIILPYSIRFHMIFSYSDIHE